MRSISIELRARLESSKLCSTAGSPRQKGRCARAIALQAEERTSLGEEIRADFPILHQAVNERPLVYLDSAATSQKPTKVTDALTAFYHRDNANVHRGVHTLAARATDAYEGARRKVAALINASDREIVWTRNATEAINLVANAWAVPRLREGDEILVSVAEHHANLVPWQMIAKSTGAVLKHVKLTADQEIDIQDLHSKMSSRTKLVSMVHVSNMLGSHLPVEQVVEAAQGVGAKVLLDCCQSVPHMPVDVRALGADWIVASGHKMCGPSGVGFLWGKIEVLDEMQPWMGGGEMIQDVYLDHSTYAPAPTRFEAGTPAIGETIALGAAVDYLQGMGMDRVHAYEEEIGTYLYEQLSKVDGVTIYGPRPDSKYGRASLCAFNIEGLHATDVSMLLDASGVAVRSGHHCTQPVHRELGITASARASCYIYNTKSEVDIFIDALKESISFFGQLNL